MLVTDSTPDFIRDFYGEPSPPEADARERAALSASAAVVYSSDYMAARAGREFADMALPPVHAVPFGLNVDPVPGAAPGKPPAPPVALAFVSTDWARKGGEVAVDALDALLGRGIPARLAVIGGSSARARSHPQVEAIPFLDKGRPRDAARFAAVLARSHVLLLPTRADCTPMVIAEANAFGCPVLVTDTGGIGSLMAPGRNGEMLAPGADGAAYAAAVERIIADPAAYRALSASSFRHCLERLTWEAWSTDLVAIVGSLRRGRAAS